MSRIQVLQNIPEGVERVLSFFLLVDNLFYRFLVIQYFFHLIVLVPNLKNLKLVGRLHPHFLTDQSFEVFYFRVKSHRDFDFLEIGKIDPEFFSLSWHTNLVWNWVHLTNSKHFFNFFNFRNLRIFKHSFEKLLNSKFSFFDSFRFESRNYGLFGKKQRLKFHSFWDHIVLNFEQIFETRVNGWLFTTIVDIHNVNSVWTKKTLSSFSS